jgi:hypothetical protein
LYVEFTFFFFGSLFPPFVTEYMIPISFFSFSYVFRWTLTAICQGRTYAIEKESLEETGYHRRTRLWRWHCWSLHGSPTSNTCCGWPSTDIHTEITNLVYRLLFKTWTLPPDYYRQTGPTDIPEASSRRDPRGRRRRRSSHKTLVAIFGVPRSTTPATSLPPALLRR